MEPIPRRVLCVLVYKDLPNVEYLPNERFVHAIYRDGRYVNYAVSNYGRVYSFYRNMLMRQFVDERRYHRIEIRIELNQTAYVGVHYLELMSFQPILNSELYVPNHKDGDPDNNMLWNLEWMTVSENTRHALDIGLANCKCENNARSILTNDVVREICSYIEQGYSNSEIATIIRKTYRKERTSLVGAISNIRRGQTYLDIAREYDIKGIKGKVDYEPEMTRAICDLISKRSYNMEELCDVFGIALEDRKMFCNYVRDITRRQKHTYILKDYPNLYPVTAIPRGHPYYEWYY